MKRTLSLLLALTMVLSLGLPAYAVGTPADEPESLVERPSVQPKDGVIDGDPTPAEEPEQPDDPIIGTGDDIISLPVFSGMLDELPVEDEIISSDGPIDVTVETDEDLPIEIDPAQDFSFSDESGFVVEVHAPFGALPAGTEMRVVRLSDLSAVQNAVDNAANLNGSVQLAADISFWLEGKEIEPAKGAKLVVKMSAPEIEGMAAPIVVHIPDGENSVPEVIAQLSSDDILMADTVTFEASSFSVYAVVEEGLEVDESRMAVNFLMPDGSNIVTVYIKNADLYAGTNDKEEGKTYIDDIVYDPGLPADFVLGTNLFRGWTIDAEDANPIPEPTEEDPNPVRPPYGPNFNENTKVYTIDEITKYLSGFLGTIKEGDSVDIYAMIFQTYTISYFGSSTTVSMGQHIAYAPLTANNAAEYTINMVYTPDDNSHFFEGWKLMSGGENIASAVKPDGTEIAKPYVSLSEADDENPATVFPNGTKLVVTGNIQFSVSAPAGHWLIFKENGKGATFNAPQFVKEGEVSFQPDNAKPGRMVRKGYTFDGWYEVDTTIDENGRAIPKTDDAGNYIFKSNTEFVFEQPVPVETIIAAKWIAATEASYTVIIWEQSVEGGDKYDFVRAIPLTGPTNSAINVITQSNTVVEETLPDGTVRRTNNVKINGEEYAHKGFHVGSYDTQNETIKIAAEGNTVVNVYYDRNNVQLRFWLVLPKYKHISADEVQTDGLFTNGGTYYLPNSSGGYDEVTLARRLVGGLFNLHYEVQIYRNGSWVALESQYLNQIYQEDGQGMQLSETYNGLYGSTLKKPGYEGQSYTWPDTRWWYEDYNDNTYTTWWGATVYGFEGKGTRTTFLDSFLPTTDSMIVNVYGFDPPTANNYAYFYQEKPDGSGYVEANRVRVTGGGTFYLSDKYTGFECYSFSTNGSNYTRVGALMKDGDNWYYDANPNQAGLQGVSYSNNIYIRFNRLKYKINFEDGIYVDGNNNPITDVVELGHIGETPEITYGADISGYGDPNNDLYKNMIPTPNEPGYVFEGWFADETGTVPYDFTTMPLLGVTVYAKWRLTQYRVFLHPNVPSSDPSLDWGDEEQSMNFRVSQGDYVSALTGIRNDYTFVGWYLDEDFNKVFDAETVALTDATVTEDYDKTARENMTDNNAMWTNPKTGKYEHKPVNKYGELDDGDPGYNADTDRFWITRKLDLYAKWKAVLDGAEGIGVVYDEVPGTGSGYGQAGTAPTDGGRLYEDNSKAIAQSASKAADPTEHFLYWVVQKWDKVNEVWVDVEKDGNLVTVYPGDNFTVLAENAKITPDPDNPGKNFYEVHLRAAYGKKDGSEPTHIYWYSNIYDIAGNEMPDAENKMEHPDTYEGITVSFEANKGYVINFEDVGINVKQEILPADTFAYEGYTFLGWARLEVESAETSNGAAPATRAADKTPSDLTEDDLFLKWDAENQQYLCKDPEAKGDTDSWIPALGVAADEFTPYHDLYAVWSGEFYVVHTGQDGAVAKTETYQITRANKDFNLLVKHDNRATDESAIPANYLYGGYYTSATAPADDKAYDGTNWTFSDPQTQDAAKISPVGGTTYYVKEVPGNLTNSFNDNYLKPKLAYTYYKDGDGNFQNMGAIYLISMVDGDVAADGTGAYKETGFIVGDKDDIDHRHAAQFAPSLKIYALDDETKFSSYTAKGNGQISYLKVFTRSSRWADPDPSSILTDGQMVYQYWVTNDNYLVYGYSARSYKNVSTYGTVINVPSSNVSHTNYSIVHLDA